MTEKREMLLRDNIKKEITYNVALLEEQIRQDLKGTERSVLESVTMAVWRTRNRERKDTYCISVTGNYSVLWKSERLWCIRW